MRESYEYWDFWWRRPFPPCCRFGYPVPRQIQESRRKICPCVFIGYGGASTEGLRRRECRQHVPASLLRRPLVGAWAYLDFISGRQRLYRDRQGDCHYITERATTEGCPYSIRISTRLFNCLFSSESFGTRGFVSPWPTAFILLFFTPIFASPSMTASALLSERAWL